MAKVRFEWDLKKDEENHVKHGISFARAQFVFADPRRVIAEDLPIAQARSGITASVGSTAEC